MAQEIETFKKANAQVQNLEQSLNHLKEAIESITVPDLTHNDKRELARIIRIAISNPDQSERMAKLFAEAYYHGRQAIAEVERVTSDISIARADEKDEKDRNAKWQRSNDWTNWRHRTSRWILGAILVVLMYSTAVWVSKHCSFIKVPVHEWIHPSQDPNELHW